MAEFLSILTLYYACDAAARDRALSHAEVMRCMAHYESVKVYFEAPRARDHTAAQSGYLAFKTWEADHPDIVAGLRTVID
ncbi:hypothetical protein [uncultured Roseobacter sp.]|uniref:hypothetical protein n=1 Tax=uncultured Roseobacter sp. TaxID=114847 RepID=UPI00260D8789|nr:hypothetical protein [uncultured Roseobacter sp.]